MELKFLRPLGAIAMTLTASIIGSQPAHADGSDRKEAIHIMLLDIYNKQQKADLAAGELKALIALKPNDPVLHGQLGRMLAQKNEFKAAIPQFLIATKNDPSNAEYWGNLGICYMQTANYNGAVNVLTKAVTTQRQGGTDWRQHLGTAQQYVQHDQQMKQYKEQQKKQQKEAEDDN
ncbi:MAG: tetratricopeptide repeat protein [Candidatus Obscuribacterales bacterium]|nr:tetratricopeptide repeat protein [Candidatus Obscuribacterales bacterium]